MRQKRVKKSILWVVMIMVGISFSAYGSYFDWQKGLVKAIFDKTVGTIYTYRNAQMIGIYDIPGGVVQHMANGNIAFMERYVPNYNREQVIGWLERLKKKGVLDENEVALILQAINSKSVNDIFNYLNQELTTNEMKDVILAFGNTLGAGNTDFESFTEKLTGIKMTTLTELKEWLYGTDSKSGLDDTSTKATWKNMESWLGEKTTKCGDFLATVTSLIGKELTIAGVTVTISSISFDDWKQMGSGYLTSFTDILNTDIATNEIWGALGELIRKGQITIVNDSTIEVNQKELEAEMEKYSYVTKATTYYTYSSEGYLETTWSYVTDKNGNIVKRPGFWVNHEKELREWLSETGMDLSMIDSYLADVESHVKDILTTISEVIESDIEGRIISEFKEMTGENFENWDKLIAFFTPGGDGYKDSNYKIFESWMSGGYWVDTNDYIANTTYYINGKLDHIEGWYQSYNLNPRENKHYLTAAEIEKLGVGTYFSYLKKNLSDDEVAQVIEEAQTKLSGFTGTTLEELEEFIDTDSNKFATLKNEVINNLISAGKISNPLYNLIRAAGTVSDTVWTKGELFFVYQTDSTKVNYGKLQYAIGNLGVYGGEIGDIGDVGYTGMGVIIADSLGRAVEVWEINPTVNNETGSQHVVDINRDNANSILSSNYVASLTLRGKIEYDAIDRVMWVGIYNGQTNVATYSTQDLSDILNNEYLSSSDAYRGLVRQVSYTYKGRRRDSRTEIYLDTTKVINRWDLRGMIEKLKDILTDEGEVAELIEALQQNALEKLVNILDKELSEGDKGAIAQELGYEESEEGWNKFKDDVKAGKVSLSAVVDALNTLEEEGTISLPSEVNLTQLTDIASMESLSDIIDKATGIAGEEVFSVLQKLVSEGTITTIDESKLEEINYTYYSEVKQPKWAVNTVTTYYYTSNGAMDYTVRTEFALADKDYNTTFEKQDISIYKNLHSTANKGGIADGEVYQGIATYQTTTFFQWGRPLYTTITEIMPPDYAAFSTSISSEDIEVPDEISREIYKRLIDVGIDIGEKFDVKDKYGKRYEVEFRNPENKGSIKVIVNGEEFFTIKEELVKELADSEKYEQYNWKNNITPNSNFNPPWDDSSNVLSPDGYIPHFKLNSLYLTSINLTGNYSPLINSYKKDDWSFLAKKNNCIDWNGDGEVNSDDIEWYRNNGAYARFQAVFRELALEPLYKALAEKKLGIGNTLEIDLDQYNPKDTPEKGKIDLIWEIVDEGGSVGFRLKDKRHNTKTPYMVGEWIAWRHLPKSEWNKIVAGNIEQVNWSKCYGDPAVTGTLFINANNNITMMVNVWTDEFNITHINQNYWNSLSENKQLEIINAAGGLENIKFFSEILTVTLKLSQLSETDRQTIINATKNNKILTLYGEGENLKPGDILVVLGLGKGQFENHPFDL